MPTDGPALLGRGELLSTIEERLRAGGGVALHGPGGIGKSALLEAVATAAAARGDLVVRLRPAPGEQALAYAGVADLIRRLPPAAPAALPPAQRAALTALRQGLPPRAGLPAAARRLVLPLLLARPAAARPVLLVLDDVQWLDPQSAELIGFAMRRRPGPRVRVLAAQRAPGPVGRHRAARLCPAPVAEIDVPPLSADDLITLLESRGLPCRTASRLHEASGGNPFLALSLSGVLATGPAWRPVTLPEPARALLRDRIAALGPEVSATLLMAALATDPTVTALVRAGRADAERDLRQAAAAGVVAVEGERVRFTPPPFAVVLAQDAPAARRAECHDALEAGAADATEAIRHRALRSGRPDAAVALRLASAAGQASGRTAAELYLLAAERCPHPLADRRLDWLVRAARIAVTAGAPAPAGRAAEAVLAAGPAAPPAHRVQARLVLLDLAGQALADMGEMFAAAVHEAAGDPALLAPVRLRLTWAAIIGGDPAAATAEAHRTIEAARAAGDATTEAMALGVLAQVQRVDGDARWSGTMARALARPAEPDPGWLHLSPRYLAARFALVDDRLDEARAELLGLLAVAERDRTGEAFAEVLRSLSEVATRAGRCREALDFAHRAREAAHHAGLSPGPTWYTTAVAELAGGSLSAAAAYARRGVRASEQERDHIYLRRNLHALGQAELRSGDARAAVAALRRLRDLPSFGATDPLIVRWRGDLAGALAALGEHGEAAETLAAARAAAERLGTGPALSGYLDRAAAIVLSECGQADAAVHLSSAAAGHFERLHQPVEQGHALLVQGGAERRRRRYAAARVAVGAALALFLAADARPWAEQAGRALARPESAAPPADLGLTSTEARIARLVRDGASNREIATQLYLSVKTVEATLTRVYRKLGVRSRTQLSSRLPAVARVFPDSTTGFDA